jgi:LysM repeat protein
LWTESWDIPSVQPGDNEGNNAAPTAVTVISWETSTPGLQGETTHVVQAGQTLVGIATVYGIPLADLLALNGLTMDSVIQPGDKILVRQAEPTPTVTQKPVITRQATPTRTRQALEASTLTLPAPPSATVTPAVNAGRNSSLAMDGVLVGIIAIGVLALVLLAWGAALQYRKRR